MRYTIITFGLCLFAFCASGQDFYSSAKTLYESNVFEAAIDFMNAKEGPLSAREWKLKADCFHKMKDYEEANDCYTECIIMNGTDAEAYARRGATYLEMGELGFAIADVKKALKIMPESAEAYFNMGNICYDQNDMTGAKKNFQKALNYRPQYPAARYMLGASKSNLGDQAGASDDFEAVKGTFPEARYNMAVVELENENYNRAIELFDEIEDHHLGDADFYFFRAECHYFMGDKENACTDYDRAGELGDEESQEFFTNYCMRNKKKGKAKKRETVRMSF